MKGNSYFSSLLIELHIHTDFWMDNLARSTKTVNVPILKLAITNISTELKILFKDSPRIESMKGKNIT